MHRTDKLKVAVLPAPHVLEVNSTSQGLRIIGGSEGNLLNLLAEGLHFEYQLLVPEDGQYGTEKENGNWTGLIGMVARKEADIALDFLSITAEREKVVDFTHPYYFSDITYFTGIPSYLPKTKAFLYPFQTSVWFCLLSVFLVVPLIFYIVANANRKRKRPFWSLTSYLYGTIINQTNAVNFKNVHLTVFLTFWKWFFQLVCLFYCAVLLSFLTVPLREPGINTVEELRQAITKGTVQCRFYSLGTAIDSAFINSKHGVLKEITDHMKETGSLNDPFNINESKHRDANSRHVFLLYRGLFNYLSALNPNFNKYVLAKESFYTTMAGIATRKNFCCREKFNRIIQRIASAGLLERYVEGELFKIVLRSKKATELEEREKPLSLKDLSGAFFLLFIGYALSIIVFIGELFLHEYHVH